jgi:prepilin-type N-terminal cleavage/methylation domain-containing protein
MKEKRHTELSHKIGFTLVEMICVLLLFGVIGLLSTRVFTNMVSGYTLAKNSDAAVQKAQNAMQRMTIDFTYMLVDVSSGTSNRITYNTSLDNSLQISIYQSGNVIYYSFNGGDYPLTDGVENNSLQFTYYNSYNSPADNAMSPDTSLIGIRYTMVGGDANSGFSQTYATRVKAGKL